MNINPIFLKDFYKVGHHEQYPEGTELLFSNWTARKSRMPGVNHAVFFGLKYFIKKYLVDEFTKSMRMGVYYTGNIYHDFIEATLGKKISTEHIEKLLNLNYLPIAIYALPELSVVPCGVPMMVMYNTKPEFAWLPGMLETLLSCSLWPTCTSATIAREYRLLLDDYARKTSDIPEFVDYQAHDFSMRGMMGVEASAMSGMAHLQYFKGTDTIPAMMYNDMYYDKPLHVCSVPATEHSVMCAYGEDNEYETYRRLISEIYPDGIVSIVSDTWNLWRVVSDYLPRLRSTILERNGRVVIRPDSGNPVEILCGSLNYSDWAEEDKPIQAKGLIECLWDIFGGTINSKGYKQLDPHIGAIYGDSITLLRCHDICDRLEKKGFASTNVVFGIGSYTYQYNTRDTLGFAMKATYAEVNGKPRILQKDPITDDGTKRSHKGLLKVVKVKGSHGYSYECLQNVSWREFYEDDNELKLVYEDGQMVTRD